MAKADKKKEAPVDKSTPKKTTEKTVKPKAKAEKIEVKVEETPQVEVIETQTEEKQFESACGASFDADVHSECQLTCAQSLPEEYNKCLAQFNAQGAVSNKKKSARVARQTDFLGNKLGTRASGINLLLSEGVTLEEMTEHFDSTDNASRSHLHTIKSKHKIEVFKVPGSNKLIYNDWRLVSGNVSIGCVDNPIASGKIVRTPEGYTTGQDVLRLFAACTKA